MLSTIELSFIDSKVWRMRKNLRDHKWLFSNCVGWSLWLSLQISRAFMEQSTKEHSWSLPNRLMTLLLYTGALCKLLLKQRQKKQTFLNRCHHLNNVKTDLNLNSSFRDEKYQCFTLKHNYLIFAKLCLFNVISISTTLYSFYSFEPTGI